MNNYKNIYTNQLRWIGFLPAAIIAYAVVITLSGLMFGFIDALNGDYQNVIMITTVCCGVSAHAFIYFGTQVAPAKREDVSALLFWVIISIGIIACLLFIIKYNNYSFAFLLSGNTLGAYISYKTRQNYL